MIGDTAKKTISQAIESLSLGVLRDPAHVRANTTQALRLFEASGLDLETFRGCLAEARSALIRRPDLRRPGAYFFEVLGERALVASGRKPCHREFIPLHGGRERSSKSAR